MKNHINFGFLVTTFIVVLFSSTNLFSQNQLPGCFEITQCLPDPNFPTITEHNSVCTYDVITNTNCCVEITYTMTRYQACPPSILPFWIFRLVDVTSSGVCYMNQDEVLNLAIQALISASLKHNITQVSASIPSCFHATTCNTGNQTAFWEACSGNGCCRYDFHAGWDSVAYDVRIVDNNIDSLPVLCAGTAPCSDCSKACNPDIFPEVGLLNLSDKLPDPCPTSCNVAQSIMPMNVEYNNNGNTIYGQFTVGRSSSNIPCLNLNYMWIKSGPSPSQSLELLIKQALFDYSLGKSLPLNIKVDFWKCIQAINPNIPYYFGCDGGCCSLEFEVKDDGLGNLEAEVTSRNSSNDPCIPVCIEVCSIFQTGGSFGIPKMTSGNNNPINQSNLISITPNPTDGIFDLNFESNNDGTNLLKIYNLSGLEVFSAQINTIKGNNVMKMNLTNLTNGTYFICLINDDYQVNKIKFIKN